MKRVLEALGWLAAICLFFYAGHAVFAQQTVTVTVQPPGTPEQRVADETKVNDLRKAAEEKRAAEESARAAATSPRALLARARTIYVSSSTSFFEAVQLENALCKRAEADAWGLALLDGWEKRSVADILIEVDRPLFTYTFTYRITDRANGVILATGKVTAFDGNAAAPKLARRIVEDIKRARGESTDDKKKKQ